MQSGFILAGFSQQSLALETRLKGLGGLAQALCFVRKAFRQGQGLLDAASLQHGAAPSKRGGGSATGDLITGKSHDPGCDGKIIAQMGRSFCIFWCAAFTL
jgi:hypothetical protein